MVFLYPKGGQAKEGQAPQSGASETIKLLGHVSIHCCRVDFGLLVSLPALSLGCFGVWEVVLWLRNKLSSLCFVGSSTDQHKEGRTLQWTLHCIFTWLDDLS